MTIYSQPNHFGYAERETRRPDLAIETWENSIKSSTFSATLLTCSVAEDIVTVTVEIYSDWRNERVLFSDLTIENQESATDVFTSPL